MDTVTESHGVDKAVIDLYGNPFYAALAQVVETLRHAPYWHVDEKAPSRLDRARELVRNSRVLLQDERLASVYGSTKAYDITGFHCTCTQSQKGQSAWCVHAVAVKLARTLAAQVPHEAAPVALGTLRAGTLPLPPVTVDERLAQSATPEAVWRDVTQEELMADEEEVSQIAAQRRDKEAPTMPQEDRMPDDDAQYIPEPDDAPTAILERPTPAPARVTAAVAAGQALLPSLDARTLEQSMQAWAEQRQVVKRFIQTQLVEGTDYYTLQLGQRTSKPTLSKAGSEKFLGLFQLHATFTQDDATWTMLGKPDGVLCYVCTLLTRTGEVVSEGRGAREVLKEKDINKAIKMAQKSAQIDAVLRTGALSEAFTQDIGPEEDEPGPEATPPKPTSADLRKRIWAHIYKAAPQVKTQDAAMAWVKEQTGLEMHPDHYAQILGQLTTEQGR